jgi:oligoendopeptidase F
MSMTAVTPDRLKSATWDDIARLYQPLIDQPLDANDPEQIEQWLADWSALDSALTEASTLAFADASADANDAEKEATHLRFASGIMPRHAEIVTTLASRLLDIGYTRPDLKATLHRFRTRRDLFRAENIPLTQQLAERDNRYTSVCGKMMVEWEGESVPVSRLQPFLQHPDRDVRERAWRRSLQPYLDHRDELADIFDEQLALRQLIAHNAGFANYRDYLFAELNRDDYTPEDCATFHQSVRQTFVPAASRIMEARQRALGVPSLRPWDLTVDPEIRPALSPYESIDAMVNTSRRAFAQLDPTFGAQFAELMRRQLLDLDSRPGKRPGGFCYPLPWQKQAVIFMNANGAAIDVLILVHEAGHAFHEIAMAELPFMYQRHVGEEMCEVASMSMELLVWPWLRAERGGFYDDVEYAQARGEHFDQIVTRFPWISVVDAFQQWLYTDPAAADRDARDQKFVEIWSQYDPHTDWTDLDDLRRMRWYRQLHIFLHPLYYIEYGIAQLGALQVWKNAGADHAGALADLRSAFALGGTRPLPELYARAGARMVFDEAGMAELVELVESELASLESIET